MRIVYDKQVIPMEKFIVTYSDEVKKLLIEQCYKRLSADNVGYATFYIGNEEDVVTELLEKAGIPATDYIVTNKLFC